MNRREFITLLGGGVAGGGAGAAAGDAAHRISRRGLLLRRVRTLMDSASFRAVPKFGPKSLANGRQACQRRPRAWSPDSFYLSVHAVFVSN